MDQNSQLLHHMNHPPQHSQSLPAKSLEICHSIRDRMDGACLHSYMHILYDLRSMQGPTPGRYLEIGSFCGFSCALMLSHPFQTEIYCIDPFNRPNRVILDRDIRDIFETNVARFNVYDKKVNVLPGYSGDAHILEALKDETFDIIFVDGDHSYAGVVSDFKNYSGMLKPGAFMVFDDYNQEPTKRAIDEMSAAHADSFVVLGCIDNFSRAHGYAAKGLRDEDRPPRDTNNCFILQKR